jgi:hypothetical protein
MRRRLAAASIALAFVLAGCSDDGDSQTATTDEVPGGATSSSAGGSSSVTSADPAFPPNDVAALKGIFDPLVEPLGLRLTRGALVDRSDGYEFSDTGSHLALYVEPMDDSTYELGDYVDNIYDVMAAVTPAVFGPYSGVLTYDICQEPYQAEDDAYEPFPVTQVEVSRAAAAEYDWDTGDLASFLAFLDAHDADTKLLVNDDVENAPQYQAAVSTAGLD